MRPAAFRLFNSGAYACTQRQMQLASTSTPRSTTNSATCSYDSGYRRYHRTHKMITSPGCWRPLKGLFGVIGMDFYPTSLLAPKFATEPSPEPVDARRILCPSASHAKKLKSGPVYA